MFIYQPLVALLVVLSPDVCSTLRTRQSAPPNDSVKIGRVTTSGNGCLQASVPFNINNPDQTVVFQRLAEFHVSLGPSIAAAERTKNCAFHIEMTYPKGWQFLLNQSSTEVMHDSTRASVATSMLNTIFPPPLQSR